MKSLIQREEWASLEDVAAELLARSGELGGGASHGAHLALGHVAMWRGDIARAKTELLLAAHVDGPTLCSFGPNMMLARKLLLSGERQAVVDYLSACGRSWEMGTDKLAVWAQQIERGEIPDFGANLSY